MIRTQVYLPQTMYQDIQLLARKENLPTAQVVRDLLSESLERKRSGIGKALLSLAKVDGYGPADLSVTIDELLYGK